VPSVLLFSVKRGGKRKREGEVRFFLLLPLAKKEKDRVRSPTREEGKLRSRRRATSSSSASSEGEGGKRKTIVGLISVHLVVFLKERRGGTFSAREKARERTEYLWIAAAACSVGIGEGKKKKEGVAEYPILLFSRGRGKELPRARPFRYRET